VGEAATYRIDSAVRGIEGPLTASAIVSMARAGLIREGDRVEASPGKWLPVTASPPVRDAIRERRGDRMYLTAASSAAALVSLRFAAERLAADSNGRAVLLAVAAQHPASEVAEHAATVLVQHDPLLLGPIARHAMRVRRSDGDWARDQVQKAIVSILADTGWVEFAAAAREMASCSSFAGIWYRHFRPPIVALKARRQVLQGSWRPTSLAEASDAIVRQYEHQREAEQFPYHSIDATGFPIEDLDKLPSRVQDILRTADNVELGNSPLRRVPVWLLCRTGSLDLAGCPIASLPELSTAESEEWNRLCEDEGDGKIHLNLARTQVSRIPKSWTEVERFQGIVLDQCPLDERSFGELPSLETLSATDSGLRDIEAFGGYVSDLNLSGNPLGRIPDCIKEICEGLVRLTMSRCGILEIPAWIEEVESPIDCLDLSENPIRRVDFQRGRAPVRSELNLSQCRIVEVTPRSFGTWFRDASGKIAGNLNLSGNLLRELPPMWYPAVLDVGRNPLQALPEPLNTFDYDPASEADPFSFGEPTCTFSVSANQTDISALPPCFEDLPCTFLSFSECPELKSLPNTLLKMDTLSTIYLDQVPLEEVSRTDQVVGGSWSPEFRAYVTKQAQMQRSISVTASRTGSKFPLRELFGHCDCPLDLRLSETALRVLAEGDISHSMTSLDVSGSAIEVLPARMGSYSALTELDLSNTLLKELPCDLGELKSLQSLKLPALDPSQYPEGLEGLSGLRSLELCGSALVRIPDFVHRLPALEELVITDTSIDELPEQLGRCQTLNRVSITKALACRVPESVLRLPGLTSLQVSGVASVSFESIPKGCALRELSVTECGRLAMPDSVDGFANLHALTLSANIADIPDAVCELPSLTSINLGREDGYDDRPGTAALRRRLSAGARARLDG
jgi:Leucine-rich repeat (LRR) protein